MGIATKILHSIREFIWPKDFAKNMSKGKYLKQGRYMAQERKNRRKR